MLVQRLTKTEDRESVHPLPKSLSESTPGAQVMRNQQIEASSEVVDVQPRFSQASQQTSESTVNVNASEFSPATCTGLTTDFTRILLC